MITRRAIVYARVALDGERGLACLQAQEEVARTYSGWNQLEVVETILDVGSGDSWQRPGLMRLQAQAQVGAFEVVVMDAPSRLFRETERVRDFLTTLKRQCGVEVIFVEWVQEGGVA